MDYIKKDFLRAAKEYLETNTHDEPYDMAYNIVQLCIDELKLFLNNMKLKTLNEPDSDGKVLILQMVSECGMKISPDTTEIIYSFGNYLKVLNNTKEFVTINKNLTISTNIDEFDKLKCKEMLNNLKIKTDGI